MTHAERLAVIDRWVDAQLAVRENSTPEAREELAEASKAAKAAKIKTTTLKKNLEMRNENKVKRTQYRASKKLAKGVNSMMDAYDLE